MSRPDTDGNLSALAKHENQVASGEEQYQEKLEELLDELDNIISTIDDIVVSNPDYNRELLEYISDRL